MKGVHNIKENGENYSFQVDNDNLGDVISYLSKFEILTLRSTPPSLEELFMTHYENKGGAQ